MKDYLKYLPAALVIITLIGTTYVDRSNLKSLEGHMIDVQKYIQTDQVEDAKLHAIQNEKIKNLEKHHD